MHKQAGLKFPFRLLPESLLVVRVFPAKAIANVDAEALVVGIAVAGNDHALLFHLEAGEHGVQQIAGAEGDAEMLVE